MLRTILLILIGVLYVRTYLEPETIWKIGEYVICPNGSLVKEYLPISCISYQECKDLAEPEQFVQEMKQSTIRSGLLIAVFIVVIVSYFCS